MLKKLNDSKIYKASLLSLPNYRNVIGELFESCYINNNCNENEDYLVRSGKFYIREYNLECIDSDSYSLQYIDFRIDPTTLIDITDIDNPVPVMIGVDLASCNDCTIIYNGKDGLKYIP